MSAKKTAARVTPMDHTRPLELSQSPIEIPKRFRKVCYNGKHCPGAPGIRRLAGGANCQQYAYEFVRAFGYAIPALRSSGLWADTAHTTTVERPQPFDLVLLNGKPDPWGAHVGVYLGKDLVLHLSKKIGVPAIESVESLMQRPKYRYLIGFKRILIGTFSSAMTTQTSGIRAVIEAPGDSLA